MNNFPSQWAKEKEEHKKQKANPQDDEIEQLYYDSRNNNA
jgi:hypothetical protein